MILIGYILMGLLGLGCMYALSKINRGRMKSWMWQISSFVVYLLPMFILLPIMKNMDIIGPNQSVDTYTLGYIILNLVFTKD